MRLQNALWVIIIMVVFGNVGEIWAYGESGGGGGSTSACGKLRFSAFTPSAFTETNNAEVAPKSKFSFFAPEGIVPKSITVTIKGQAVPVLTTPKDNGFEVIGVLPDTIKGTFARINIAAKSVNRCELQGGWLLKVADTR